MAKNQKSRGTNRAQRRADARQPKKQGSDKPTWIRILILVMLSVLFIGFFLSPLLR